VKNAFIQEEAIPVLSHKTENVDEKLFSDVVHKIKNGLGGIGGFAALLERDLDSDDPRKRLVHRIQDGVVKLNDVLVNLMTLVQVQKPCAEKICLQTIVKEVWTKIWGAEQSKDLAVYDLLSDKVEILADPQIIRKLIFHAIRFTNLVGGQIEAIKIHSQREGRVEIVISFLDGTSFTNATDNILSLINEWEPVEARLSLAIVDKLVKVHGGKVSIASCSGDVKVMTIQLSH